MNSEKSRNLFSCHLLLRTFVLSLIAVFTWCAFAGEGFNHDPTLLPQSIQKVWNSVFMLAPAQTGGIGSAALVSIKETSPFKYELTFLTTGHVVRQSCGNIHGYCDNLELSTGKAIDTRNMSDMTDPSGITILGANIVRRLNSPDLALLKVTVQGRQYAELKPVRISKNCDVNENQQVFLIGHPLVMKRKSLQVRHKEFITKRWSTGYIVGHKEFTGKAGRTVYATTSTADSLGGNSGGATVNLRGELIGIHIGARLNADKEGVSYLGDETSNPKVPHAIFARCEFLESFISMGPMIMNPEDYYKKPRSSSKSQFDVQYLK